MQLIRPTVIDDTVLHSTNVVEAAPAAYAGGTTYSLGQTVSVATGTALAVYTSLQNGNVGNTPASSPTWWHLTGNTYAQYAGGTTYALGDIVINVSTNIHEKYQSLKSSNVGNALSDSTSWLDLGADNTWDMFDTYVTSQTSNPDSIDVVLYVNGRADSVAVLNCNASFVQIKMTDAIDGLVYNNTISLVSPSGIQDWYDYFFEPIERIADLAVTNLPPYTNATIEVILSATGENVTCGACIVGLSKTIGNTQYGASVSIQDFSVKSQDAFGNFSIVERAFSKTGSFTVWVDGIFVDTLQTLLAGYRATPIVYLGDETGQYESTLIFGFYKDFSIQIAYPTESVCTLDIEGMI